MRVSNEVLEELVRVLEEDRSVFEEGLVGVIIDILDLGLMSLDAVIIE